MKNNNKPLSFKDDLFQEFGWNMLSDSDLKELFASLWCKLIRVSVLSGAGGGFSWSEDYNPLSFSRHAGFIFEKKSEKKEPSLIAEKYLKEMVCYIEPKSIEYFENKNNNSYDYCETHDEALARHNKDKTERDAGAFTAVLNFEEVRTVGKPYVTLTNTYCGYANVRGTWKQMQEHKLLVEWLIEFEE